MESSRPPGGSANTTTPFGWDICDGISIPVLAQGDQTPPELIDAISVSVEHRARCSTEARGCHKQHLNLAHCLGDESCCNQYTMPADAQPGDEVEFDVDLKKRILKGRWIFWMMIGSYHIKQM